MMGASRTHGSDLTPGLAEAEATQVWTEQRLRALRREAFVGGDYDPDAFDIALVAQRAARLCAAAARHSRGGISTHAV
jgi:hypothetical protein